VFVHLDTTMLTAPNSWFVKTSVVVAGFAFMAFASVRLDMKETIVLRKSLSAVLLVLTIALSADSVRVGCVNATLGTVEWNASKWMRAIVEHNLTVLEMDVAKMDSASVILDGLGQVATWKSSAQTTVRVMANVNGDRAGATCITLPRTVLNVSCNCENNRTALDFFFGLLSEINFHKIDI
jgi:hypothetical protein